MKAYLAKYVQENITEESLKNSYKNYIADVTSREEVKASHILLDTEVDALLVIKQLNNDESFEELAKMKSKGPSGPSGSEAPCASHRSRFSRPNSRGLPQSTCVACVGSNKGMVELRKKLRSLFCGVSLKP